MQEMLAALRRRGMHDVALDYLDSLRTSRLVDEQVKRSIPYEEGLSLVDRARNEPNTAERLASLDAARAKFETFLAAQADGPEVAAARTQLGNLLVERGRAVRDSGQERDEARALLSDARKQLADAATQFEDRLRAMGRPEVGEDSTKTQKRDELRRQLLQARLFAAQAIFELALAYDAPEAERKKLLDEAAAAYQDIHEKYPKVLGGFYARLWQGRCLAEQGQWNQALTVYDEIRALPEDNEDFRQLRAKALLYSFDAWLASGEGQPDKAIEEGEAWLAQLRGAEDRSPDHLEIRWRLAELHARQSDSAGDKAAAETHRGAAIEHAKIVGDATGPRRMEARQLVSKLQGRDEKPQAKNFAEARQQAEQAIERLQVAESRAAAKGPDAEGADAAEAERRAAADDAADALRRQLALRDDKTSIDEINEVRRHLAFVELARGNHYAAAALGEFLARRYPDFPHSRAGAKIALAAYLAEYNRLGDVDRTFETQRLTDLARYLAEKWPREPEANEAWLMLGDIAAREGRLDEALAHFEKVAPDTPQRLLADLAGGQIVWSRYLTAAQSPPETRPPAEQLARLQEEARTKLEAAVSAARKGNGSVNYTLLAGELSLAQLYAERGENERALETLDRPKSGVLALVAEGAAVTDRGNFRLEAQKVALRAAVGAGRVDRAQAVLESLAKGAAGNPEAEAALARIYMALGRELQQQIERLQSEGQPEELTRLLDSFELFLTKLSERPQEGAFESLQWAADTWQRLGAGLAESKELAARGKKYLGRSAELYEALLARADKESGFVTSPDALLLLQLRGAAALRSQGKYERGLERVVEVLKRSPNQLEAQFEAAQIYQDWGRSDANQYKLAMIGARPARDQQGREFQLVWGWGKLANALQRMPQHSDKFLEARYNLATCRFRWALRQGEAERRAGLLAAERDIAITTRLKSDLGGPSWTAKYDALAKAIQQAAGRPATGLKGLMGAAAAPPSQTTSSR